MAKNKNVGPEVQVTYVSTPDSEIRIANAIEMLLAADYPIEECTVHSDENQTWENGSSDSEYEGNFNDECR